MSGKIMYYRIKVELLSVGLLLFFFQTQASAIDTVSQEATVLQQYDCPSIEAARSCSAECRIYPTKSSYLADVGTQTVAFIHYKNMTPYFNGKLEECQVKDKDNWVCTTKSKNISSRVMMENGLYIAESNNAGLKINSYYCAK
jgi:hypothetical protein